ncbi:hypothetical protein [Acetobacter sp. DmW_043]|uniref:hypothetical protein n=1 Tax=Acetobacter sp. DmW_043 TaxID=1670658 RepID=UPI001302239E|nr:hypothetical protein [Acetobacter sp. DmW_043]
MITRRADLRNLEHRRIMTAGKTLSVSKTQPAVRDTIGRGESAADDPTNIIGLLKTNRRKLPSGWSSRNGGTRCQRLNGTDYGLRT